MSNLLKKDRLNETYPETGKHFFYKNEMHDVLHYDGGKMVKIAPSLRCEVLPVAIVYNRINTCLHQNRNGKIVFRIFEKV
jgi:hypothetical protein